MHLLGLSPPPPRPGRTVPGPWAWLLLIVLAFMPVQILRARRRTFRDRIAPASIVLDACLGLALVWAIGPWGEAPALAWSAGAAVTGVAGLGLLRRTRGLPFPHAAWPRIAMWLRLAAVVISVGALAAGW
jgi:hypothetical protein